MEKRQHPLLFINRLAETPGYNEGETKVAFAGNLDGQLLPPAPVTTFSSLTGQKQTGEAYTEYRYLQIMINDLLLSKTSILSKSQASQLGKTDKVMTLSTWPNPGSVQLIDGVVVVKFSQEHPRNRAGILLCPCALKSKFDTEQYTTNTQ